MGNRISNRCFSRRPTDQELLLCTLENTPKFSLEGQCFSCVVVDCYDGDTCTVAMYYNPQRYLFKVRLAGIDTPEMNGNTKEIAINARNYLISLISSCPLANSKSSRKDVQEHLNKHKQVLTLRCGGWDKYGRLLGTLITPTNVNVNQLLVTEGYAKPYDGGTKQTFESKG